MSAGTADYTIDDLRQLMARLRDPDDGCPWDRKQTMRSVVRHTLEECHELADAIEHDDIEHIREELGDVLFQVVFYARIAEENGQFDLSSVIDDLVGKLLRRHPHVFPDGTLPSRRRDGGGVGESEIKERWEAIKATEREQRQRDSLMDDIPLALPALARAGKLQKRAARVTFDWYHSDQVLDKVAEELGELQSALAQRSPDRIEDEAGDVLFTMVNYLRHVGVDAESALRRGNRKFERRFRRMEILAAEAKRSLEELDASGLDGLWQRVKSEESLG